MPVVPVNRVVDKIKIAKMEGRGGGEAQGADNPNKNNSTNGTEYECFCRELKKTLHWYKS
jgi:hypothetical protein